MRASIVISALVAVLVGFGGSLAVVLSATQAVGASVAQTASWVTALCLVMAVTTLTLSVYHRLPIITAWSTPGAALIGSTQGIAFEAAVGAFLLSAVLILATSTIKPLGQVIERIPTSIASAMLAGVLFNFTLAVFQHLSVEPALVVPLLIVFALVRLKSPSWAVLAVLGVGGALAAGLGRIGPIEPFAVSGLFWVQPSFDWAVLIGLGVPLYLVTMASQNLPGFVVLRADGYPVPSRSILGVTGLASFFAAFAGAHTSNLAAITAALCTGPDTHPDPSRRWLCGPIYGAGYAILALFGASLVGLFAALPPSLIATIAGLALLGPLVGALSSSLSEADDRYAAVLTFVVTVSGLQFFGIGSAFWGLVIGLLVLGLNKLWK